MQARFTPVLAVIALLVSPELSCSAWGQALSRRNPTMAHETPKSETPKSETGASETGASETGPAGPYVVTGRLERREERFALVDEQGVLEAYLIPRESLDLDSYVGEAVKLSVREPILHTDGEPRLWVDRILSAANRAPTRPPQPLPDGTSRPRTALAQFTEPMMDEELMAPGVAVAVAEVTNPCGPRGWIWGSAEYLLWRTDGMSIPALVTTSPLGTPRDESGVLGEPGTTIWFGDEDILSANTNGVRLRSGLYFDRQSQVGVQSEYFMLETQTDGFFAGGNASGTPILARPFFNINPRFPVTDVFDPPPREDAQLASYPGVMRGSISVDATSRLQSAGLALRSLLACESFCNEQRTAYSRVDMITGYRYMRLNDHLLISEDLSSLDRLSLASFEVFDQFDTRNQLHAMDIGAVWQGGWQRFSLDLTLKTAIGYARQEVDIQGGTIISQPSAATETYAAGVLALPSNIGTYSRNRVAVVPELGAVVGFQILPKVRATVGYTFIFWGPVVRAGDQIDLDVNPDQMAPPIVPLAGPLRPDFAFQESNYWAQGLSLGVEGRW
jgi:hypothetical protein